MLHSPNLPPGNFSPSPHYANAQPSHHYQTSPQIMSYPQQINPGMGQIPSSCYPRPSAVQRNVQVIPQGQYMQNGYMTGQQPFMMNHQNQFPYYGGISGPYNNQFGWNEMSFNGMQPNNDYGMSYGGFNNSDYSRINTNIDQERVYCVICQNTYSYSERQSHIQKHKMMGQSSKKINYLIQNYDYEEGPVLRPIVQPQEFNIQYNPNKYILQHGTNYATQQYNRPMTSQAAIGTDSQPRKKRNTPNMAPNMGVINEEPHEAVPEPYQPQNIRLSDGGTQDMQQFIVNDYRNFNHNRRPKSNNYTDNTNQNNPQIPINNNIDQRFSRDTFISDQQSQPRGIDYFNNRETMQSQYRTSNVDNSRSYQNQSYMTRAGNQPVIRETEQENRISNDINQNTYNRNSTYNDPQQSQVRESNYRQPSQVSQSNRQPSQINDSYYKAPSQVSEANYKQQPSYRQSSQVSESNYRQTEQSRQPSQVNQSNYLQPQANQSNFRATQSSYRQPSQVSQSNYRQPPSQVNESNYRQSSQVFESNYRQTEQSRQPSQNYRESSNQQNYNNRMTYNDNQIPFEQIVGEKRGMSYYEPREEDSLDIIEGAKSFRK